MMQRSRFRIARGILLAWCLFIGIGAVGGAACMLARPDGSVMGMQGLLPYFQVLPFADAVFQDFVFPGIALLVVNGLTNLTAAGLILARKRVGIALGGAFGVTLMAWITIQFVIFPANFLSTAYFLFGAAQAATGYVAWVFDAQERFSAQRSDDPAARNSRELVVYFSRMGYCRKIAQTIAGERGAVLREIKTPERTAGTAGFWWCGRFGMHGWPMKVEEMDVDATAFDRVVIVSPIWVFRPASPVLGFCDGAAGKIRRAEYVFVHFMSCPFRSAARTLDGKLGLTGSPFRSIRCRMGAFREEKIKR